MYDLLIKGGLIVTAESFGPGEVAVSGEKIAAVGKPGALGKAKEVIDASGRLVMPGLIDPHVHARHPFAGGYSLDDPYTASVSAAHGGVTTFLDFAIQWDQKKTLKQTVQNRCQEFTGEAAIDWGLHACPTAPSIETIDEMPELITGAAPSLKLYMTYSKQGRMAGDGMVFECLRQTAEHGGIVGVHAENDDIIRFTEARFIKEGRTGPADFPKTRGNHVEAEAVQRAIILNQAAGGNLHVFHLSTAEGVKLVAQAQADGNLVSAETCSHYLILDEDYYNRPDGANFICSPPLRSAKDKEALWAGIRSGVITMVSSDHCGFGLEQKASGQSNFTKIPCGLPGIELRLPVVYTEGVASGRITPQQLVQVLSANAAKKFGMYPQKGSLLPGSDADIVIVEINRVHTVAQKYQHGPADWTPYEGLELQGFVDTTILRGSVIVDNYQFFGSRGGGRQVPRAASTF